MRIRMSSVIFLLLLSMSYVSYGMYNNFQKRVDPNVQDEYGDTYLHRVMKNNKDKVRAFEKLKIALRKQSERITDFNVQNNDNETILYLASGLWNNVSVIKTLVECGAKINIGKSCLAHALSKGNNAVAQFLLERGANPNISWLNCPNAFLLCAGNEEIFLSLMRYGSDPNIPHNEMSLSALQRSLEMYTAETEKINEFDLKQRMRTLSLRSIALMCECERYAADKFIAVSIALKRKKIKVPKVLLAEIVNRSLGYEMIGRGQKEFCLKSRVSQETLMQKGTDEYTLSQFCASVMKKYDLSSELKVVAPVWGGLSELFDPEKKCIERMKIAKNIKKLMDSDYKEIDKKEEAKFCLLG